MFAEKVQYKESRLSTEIVLCHMVDQIPMEAMWDVCLVQQKHDQITFSIVSSLVLRCVAWTISLMPSPNL